MDLINRLKHYMDASHVTISQFADRCGIPRPTMSQLINGRNKRISDEVINKIHNAYPNLSILWLMFGEGSMESVSNIEISEPQNAENSLNAQQQTAVNQDNASIEPTSNIFSNNLTNSETFENSLFDTPQSENINSDFAASGETMIKDNILFDSTTSQDRPIAQPYQQPSSQSAQIPTTNDTTRTVQSSSTFPSSTAPRPMLADEERNDNKISISPDAHKKITNIVVFYSDNSFQSFLPDA